MTVYRAFCSELPLSATGDLPEWIELISAPIDGAIRGRDGRAYTHSNPLATMAAWVRRGIELPIDINHSSEISAPKGEPSPAVGFIRDLQARPDGSIWGRADWTEFGKSELRAGRYKFISPAFYVDAKLANKKLGTLGDITELTSIGIVNKPNFDLMALNAEEKKESEQENSMDKELAKALGLAEDATVAQAAAKIAELEDAATKPELASEQVKSLVETAVQAAVKPLQEQVKKARELAHSTVIDQYVAMGKIQPTEDSKKFWLNACGETDEQLAIVQKQLDSMPVLVSTNAQLPGLAPQKGSELTANQLKICAMLQVSEEEYKKSLASRPVLDKEEN